MPGESQKLLRKTVDEIATSYLTPRSRRKILREPSTSVPCVREELTVDGDTIAVRSWGSGPSVLLVHGWSANQSSMFNLVPPIIEHGFKAIAMDLPAHGESSGKIADLDDLAAGVERVYKHVGDLHAVVAHSVGAAVTTMALSVLPSPRKLVLLAPPESYERQARAFARIRGLDEIETEEMIRVLEERGTRIALLTSDYLRRLSVPTLIVHSRDDEMIPFSIAEHLAGVSPSGRLLEFSQLGHLSLLIDSSVIGAVLDFICE